MKGNTQMNTNGTNPNTSAFLKGALTPDQIAQIMGESRKKNIYGPKLLEFLNSDEAAINVREVWPADFDSPNPNQPHLATKAATLYQGFINAAKNANVTDLVRIINRDNQVFILHVERAKLAVAVAAPSQPTDDTTF